DNRAESLVRRGRGPDQEAVLPAGRVVAVTTYRATAVRWSGGWELHIDGEGVTQVRTLDRAADQVRDYVATLRGTDTSASTVDVRVNLGGIEDRARDAKERTAQAARDQEAAASELREVARALRAEGLS